MPEELQQVETPEQQRRWEAESFISALEAGLDITDDFSYADWYANTTLILRDEETRLKLQHEHRMRQVEAKIAELYSRHHQAAGDATARLIDAKGGKAKSVDLPRGRVGFRTMPVKAEYQDVAQAKALAETFVPAAAVYAEETKLVPKVDKKALLAAATEYAKEHGGAMPDGITIEGGDEKFYVDGPKSK